MITEEQKSVIKSRVEALWGDGNDLPKLAKDVMEDFIFGPTAANQHFMVDDVYAVVLEVNLEKNPVEELPIEE